MSTLRTSLVRWKDLLCKVFKILFILAHWLLLYVIFFVGAVSNHQQRVANIHAIKLSTFLSLFCPLILILSPHTSRENNERAEPQNAMAILLP